MRKKIQTHWDEQSPEFRICTAETILFSMMLAVFSPLILSYAQTNGDMRIGELCMPEKEKWVACLTGGLKVSGNASFGGKATGVPSDIHRAVLFPGASAGAKISAAITELPSTGGTVDARGLEGAQNIATDVFTSVTKNVTLLWGAGTYAFSANTTIPANIHHVFAQGTRLEPATATTLTIQGSFDAPLTQIFGGAGVISFSGNTLEDVYPQWWGAKGDNTTQSATAIQAAIDAAQTQVTSNSVAPVVRFVPGNYRLNAGITWKTAQWVGAWPNTGVRMFWDGSAGATVITRDGTVPGGGSFALMYGVTFRNGTARPGTWLDATAASADKFFILDKVQFIGSTGDAIKFGSWVNLHLTDLRWDATGGYAIRFTPVASQALSSFVLDRFTYDHQTAGDAAPGMILIDNTANASNLGVFAVKNGRIEVNVAWGTTQAIVTVKKPDPGNARTVGLWLENITYQHVVGMANDVILYQDTASTTSNESLFLKNVRTQGLSATLGGTWVSGGGFIPLPSGGTYSSVEHWGGPGTDKTVFEQIFRTSATTQDIIGVRNGTETVNRFAVRGDGRLAWGDGASAVDTTLSRAAAGRLRSDHQFQFASGIMNDGGGFKHRRVTTGSISASSTADVTVTWTTAFADANYTVFVEVLEGTAGNTLEVLKIVSQAAGSAVVRVRNNDTTARTGTLHCIAVHD